MTALLSPRRRQLLFALALTAGILNLVDRQIIAVLKPTIAADLHWSDDDYGTLAALFQTGAAFGFLAAGWLVDRLGVRRANAFGVAAWSLAASIPARCRMRMWSRPPRTRPCADRAAA